MWEKNHTANCKQKKPSLHPKLYLDCSREKSAFWVHYFRIKTILFGLIFFTFSFWENDYFSKFSCSYLMQFFCFQKRVKNASRFSHLWPLKSHKNVQFFSQMSLFWQVIIWKWSSFKASQNAPSHLLKGFILVIEPILWAFEQLSVVYYEEMSLN